MSVSAAAGRKGKSDLLTEMCSVRVGSALYGIPISHILEIVGAARPEPVPLAPPFVGGLVHYRGDVLTTVSLRQLLGLPPLERPQAVLVLESAGGCFGLLVDSVGEVLTVSSADHEANPSILDESRKEIFVGAYKLNDKLLVMLDPERLDPMRLALAGVSRKPAQAGSMAVRAVGEGSSSRAAADRAA